MVVIYYFKLIIFYVKPYGYVWQLHNTRLFSVLKAMDCRAEIKLQTAKTTKANTDQFLIQTPDGRTARPGATADYGHCSVALSRRLWTGSTELPR